MPNKRSKYGWKAHLADIVARHVHTSISIRHAIPAVSQRTKEKRWMVLFNAFRDLRELGFKLDDPRHLRLKHVIALARHWERVRQSPSTIENKLSILRTYAAWIGKATIIPASTELVLDPASVRRNQVRKPPSESVIRAM